MLGIAETAFLADWKEDELNDGQLDTYTLTNSGRQIGEKFFSEPPLPMPPITSINGDNTVKPAAIAQPITPIYHAGARIYQLGLLKCSLEPLLNLNPTGTALGSAQGAVQFRHWSHVLRLRSSRSAGRLNWVWTCTPASE